MGFSALDTASGPVVDKFRLGVAGRPVEAMLGTVALATQGAEGWGSQARHCWRRLSGLLCPDAWTTGFTCCFCGGLCCCDIVEFLCMHLCHHHHVHVFLVDCCMIS